MTPQFLVLARSWAQAYGSTWPGPCLQKARPAAACSPSRVSASEGSSLLPEPARRLKLGLGGVGSCTQPSDQDPGKSQERRLPPGKGAGGRASASPFTSMPRVGKVGRGAVPHHERPRCPPRSSPPSRSSASPSPLPRKAEGFPSGPDTPWHRWCSWLCRARLGRRRGGSQAAATWSGAGGVRDEHRAAPALKRKYTLGSACPGQGPPSSSPQGLWSPRSRRPRLGASHRTWAAGSEQRLPGLPGSSSARGGAEGMEEGGQGGGRKAAARPPLLLSARRSAPSGAQTTAAASHAARAGAGLRGWGRARAGACSHTPPCGPAALGTQQPGTWWPKEQSRGF